MYTRVAGVDLLATDQYELFAEASWIAEALALATTLPLVSDIAARLPLDRVADAYRVLDSGVSGKVLVLPHESCVSGCGVAPQ